MGRFRPGQNYERFFLDTDCDSDGNQAEDNGAVTSDIRSRWVPSPLSRLPGPAYTPGVDDHRVAYMKGTNNGGSPTDMTVYELQGLANFFPWPKGIKLRLPCQDGGSLANYPGYIVLYEDLITAGFRLPLHPFICDFLCDTKLCPAQLSPNAWRNILAFLIKFKDLGRPPSYEAFKYMCNIRPMKRLEEHTYSLYFKGFDLINTPRIPNAWGKKWFLVCQSEGYEFNFPMYPSPYPFVKSPAMRGPKHVDSQVEDLIQIFRTVPVEPGFTDYNIVLDSSRLEEAGLSLPHPVAGPVELYEKYVSKRKRDVGSSEGELKSLEGNRKRARTCTMVLRDNHDTEDDVEEDPEEEESETSSITTLSRPEVATALKRLPEIILAAQKCEDAERELKVGRRENAELKRENCELRRREMKLADELERTKRELQILRVESEKKTTKDELIDESKIIEATQKAKEFLELSSSIFKNKQ